MSMSYVFAVFVVIASSSYVFGGFQDCSLLLDVHVEFQRAPWLALKIRKVGNNIGSHDFIFNWNVQRNIENAHVIYQKWPLLPQKYFDKTEYNQTFYDKACDFIHQNLFGMFDTKRTQPCAPDKNMIRKGNYSAEYRINEKEERVPIMGLGTVAYVVNIDHYQAPFMKLKLLVDTNICIVDKFR